MNLKDVSISKTEFYLRKTERSSREDRRVFWDDFKRIVQCVENRTGGVSHAQTDYLSLEEPPFQQGRITPIVSSPWTEDNGTGLLRRFISRVFLDVFSLQTFSCRSGEISADELPLTLHDLAADLAECSAACETAGGQKISALKYDCRCYWIESKGRTTWQRSGDDVLATVFGSADFHSVDLSVARLGFQEERDRASFCILVKNAGGATTLFNDLLSEYFLCWAKVRNEEFALKTSRSEDERANLNAALDAIASQRQRSLTQLEKINLELTEQRTAFAEKLTDIEFHLRTLEINISNARKLIQKPPLNEKSEPLEEFLIKPLRLVAEQTNAYADYYRIVLEKSRIIGEKIANDSNLISGRYTRRLTFLFGLFSLIGLLQLFPDFANKLGSYEKIAILGGFIVLLCLIAFRADIKNWLTRPRDSSSKSRMQG